MSFEESVKQLDEIIERLGDSDLDLEASLDLYSKGVALIDGCTRQLSSAQQKLEVLGLGQVEKQNESF